MSPYRNPIGEAQQKLAAARAALSLRAAALDALRPLLPPGLRHDLARLERAMERPLRHTRDVESAERALSDYAEVLEVAIAFSDHVARDRAARWRRQRSWLRWVMAGATAVALLSVLGAVQSTAHRHTCVLGASCFTEGVLIMASEAVSGASASNDVTGALPTSDQPTAENPCGLSVECARHGRCATSAAGCVANSADDCQSSWDCRLDGLCQLVAGRCTAATDQDCAAALDCRLEGRCLAHQGQCISMADFSTLAASQGAVAGGARLSD